MIYQSLKTFLFVFSFLLLLTSCGKSARILKPNQMTDVLFDIHLAEGVYKFDQKNYRSYGAKDSIVDAVLQKHRITQADLDSSLVYYSDHIQDYNKINDTLKKRLQSTLTDFTAQKNLVNKNKEIPLVLPTRLWLGKNHMSYVFSLDSFKIKKYNLSRFKLAFSVFGKSDSLSGIASVYYTYKDTVVRRVVHIHHNRSYVLDYPHLHDTIVKNIAGYFKFKRTSSRFYAPRFLIYNITYKEAEPKTEKKELATKKKTTPKKSIVPAKK